MKKETKFMDFNIAVDACVGYNTKLQESRKR